MTKLYRAPNRNIQQTDNSVEILPVSDWNGLVNDAVAYGYFHSYHNSVEYGEGFYSTVSGQGTCHDETLYNTLEESIASNLKLQGWKK